MTAAEDRLGEIEGRAAAVDAALDLIDEREAIEGNYAVSIVPSIVIRATEASALDVPLMAAALRAVLALHAPVAWKCVNPVTFKPLPDETICGECSDEASIYYPCPTVTAITAALTPAEVEL